MIPRLILLTTWLVHLRLLTTWLLHLGLLIKYTSSMKIHKGVQLMRIRLILSNKYPNGLKEHKGGPGHRFMGPRLTRLIKYTTSIK